MSPPNERGRPGKATSETSWETTVTAQDTAPFRRTSCANTCPDCAGTGRIGLHPCARTTQYVRRVAWPYWAEQMRGAA